MELKAGDVLTIVGSDAARARCRELLASTAVPRWIPDTKTAGAHQPPLAGGRCSFSGG